MLNKKENHWNNNPGRVEGENSGMTASQTMREVFADRIRKNPESIDKISGLVRAGKILVKSVDDVEYKKDFKEMSFKEKRLAKFVAGAAEIVVLEEKGREYGFCETREYFKLVQENERLGNSINFDDYRINVAGDRAFVGEKKVEYVGNTIVDRYLNGEPSFTTKLGSKVAAPLALAAAISACAEAQPVEVAPIQTAEVVATPSNVNQQYIESIPGYLPGSVEALTVDAPDGYNNFSYMFAVVDDETKLVEYITDSPEGLKRDRLMTEVYYKRVTVGDEATEYLFYKNASGDQNFFKRNKDGNFITDKDGNSFKVEVQESNIFSKLLASLKDSFDVGSVQAASEDVVGTVTAEAGATQTAEVTATPAPTATETEIPTSLPTLEESVEIVGEIFQNPQLKEDLKNVIISPSPIDSPEEYAEWKKELNEILREELPNHREMVVDIKNGEGVTYNYQSKIVSLPSAEWKAISAYKFGWNGEEVLTKVFPVSVNGGEVLFFHVTYSADDVMFYNTQEEPYKIEGESFLRIFCAPGTERHPFRGEMLKEYSDEQLDSLRRVLAGHAEEGDIAVVLDMEFVLRSIERE